MNSKWQKFWNARGVKYKGQDPAVVDGFDTGTGKLAEKDLTEDFVVSKFRFYALLGLAQNIKSAQKTKNLHKKIIKRDYYWIDLAIAFFSGVAFCSFLLLFLELLI